MLLILLYHRLDKEQFQSHLKHIQSRYQLLLPGEPLKARKQAVCITFDDAYEDVYTIALPLLRQYQMRALLAVPTGLVGQPGHCSWAQLAELAASGHFQFASHSHSHPNMAQDQVDLAQELVGSRQLLEQKLNVTVSTFVYPYGKVGHLSEVLRSYRYAMRIGTAINRGWDQQPLCRVVADGCWPFGWRRRLSYLTKMWWRGAFPKRLDRPVPSGQPSAGG
jgi:peptidoglycan/xylan/chitin deacetylase (PgdA/CDA1 family)